MFIMRNLVVLVELFMMLPLVIMIVYDCDVNVVFIIILKNIHICYASSAFFPGARELLYSHES